ncbi:MAG: (Fe-S)-binding protein, partial [Propionibacteriaceae bacterium]
NRQRSFCCGAGGARMWMEEKIGTRINVNRTEEALTTLTAAHAAGPARGESGPGDAIATGCPFCRVMLSDGLTAKQADGSAAADVEVLDVAQLLLESVRRSS